MLANSASAARSTGLVKITYIGQYGANSFHFRAEEDVSVCSNKKELYFDTSNATNYKELYSTLLVAFSTGKKMNFILHDPVVCDSSTGAQKINQPNYYSLYN